MEKLSKTNKKLLEDFALYVQALGYKTGSQQSLKGGVKAFLLWLESQSIKGLTTVKRSDLKAYQIYLENRPKQRSAGGLSSKMIRDYLSCVRMLFKYAEQQNSLLINPMSSYVLPPCKSERRAILNRLEIEQLYQACESLKERCVLHIYYGLGLRRKEGERLNINDIDYRKGWLSVLEGKGGKGRSMPLSPVIQNDLRAYVLEERGQSSSPALLLNKNGKRLRGYSSLLILKQLLKRTGIGKKIDLHSLRHSIATHLLQSGMALDEVRRYLGHSHLESTQRYLHYDARQLFTEQVSPK
ncbi:tyrosine-type recombinase/integrase [Aureispira anguillae]|uniref:Tyrosine-type recombinase/integrase n=1 Tax=Aureispira anguillae TaxID=2864201 RepID=A0A915YCS8_9BACT|nr:tyrosine-type recombinase/integrase [Aureispira anguillae]BDS10678.1 tyrosine-type recombinase/integrase [Aureispira anguillae]